MKLEITILLSFLLSVLTASIISQVGSKTALVDHPNYRSSHSLPTPRGGGIGIWLVFASFVVKLSVTINIFLCMIMFLYTFCADAAITIFYRWKRGENLMQAHRSHLYQYLSNELKLPHWKVTLLYAVVQLCFGVVAVVAYRKGLVIQLILLLSFSMVFLVSYNLVKMIKPRLSEQ